MSQMDGPRWGPLAGGAPTGLVVLCHGWGSNGADLIALAPVWARAVPGLAFVSPDAPELHPMAPGGRQWFGLEDRTPAMMEQGARRAATALDAFIDAELARLGLPAGAYALMGFSQGAMTALFVGLRRAVPPRAILAYAGVLIAPESLAGEITHRPPVLLVHGTADEVVPVAASRSAEQVLGGAGVPVTSLWPPGLGHGIDEAGLSAGAAFLHEAFA